MDAAAAERAMTLKAMAVPEEDVRRKLDEQVPATTIGAASNETADEENPGVAADDDVVCVVCMEGLERGQLCRALSCGHMFHARCVDSWWVRQGRRGVMQLRCPTCRGSVCELSRALPPAAGAPDGEDPDMA
mmetsp:Transcript_54930/g.108487  ORF Transcript_54930/g.108487 Transcript_54930/m.108487 type:complete len:132 (+) Transcript_54930:2-397(+)